MSFNSPDFSYFVFTLFNLSKVIKDIKNINTVSVYALRVKVGVGCNYGEGTLRIGVSATKLTVYLGVGSVHSRWSRNKGYGKCT